MPCLPESGRVQNRSVNGHWQGARSHLVLNSADLNWHPRIGGRCSAQAPSPSPVFNSVSAPCPKRRARPSKYITGLQMCSRHPTAVTVATLLISTTPALAGLRGGFSLSPLSSVPWRDCPCALSGCRKDRENRQMPRVPGPELLKLRIGRFRLRYVPC
jgi:hypothetical protein